MENSPLFDGIRELLMCPNIFTSTSDMILINLLTGGYPMFRRIDHIAFNIKDREKSIEFYEKHFGFRKYYEHDVPVPTIEKIVYLKLGDTVLELIHIPNSKKNQGYHFCLESDNFAGDYQRLKQAGIPIQTEPHPAGAREPHEEGWQRVVFIGPDEEAIEIRG